MIPGSANPLLLKSAAAAGAYQIERSLRFNSSDSAYCSRTPAVAGNRKTWTWAGWVKRSSLGSGLICLADARTGTNESPIMFNEGPQDTLSFYQYIGGFNWQLRTTQVFRDVGAWFHLVVAVDTTQATAANRIKIYLNGSEITTFAIANYPSQNSDTFYNSTNIHTIGAKAFINSYFDGYLADIHFIDGQQLTPSSFTEVSATTGQLIPKTYTGTFGTNGFWLKFSDNSAATAATLGKDYSGNSNNWTPNNLSVTAGAGNDSLVDTPTSNGTDTGVGGSVRGNYCTLNPVGLGGGTLSNGNLDLSTSTTVAAVGTVAMKTGKWYWEITCNTVANPRIGVFNIGASSPTGLGNDANGWCLLNSPSRTFTSGGATAYGTFSPVSGTIVNVAYDADAGKLWFGQDGSYFASGNPATGANASMSSVTGSAIVPALSSGGTDAYSVNFGQRPFAYTAPSGFKALCDTNLPAPVVAKPNTVMDVVLYTGTGASLTPTSSLGFNPDWIWIKSRSAATDHALYDVVRGAQARLESNTTDAEVTTDGGVTAFNSAGFTLGTLAQVNTSAATYAAWCWDAGTSTVSNTAGSITSQVRANVSAGFSIVKYPNVGSTNSTIGHGLGVAPKLVIVRYINQVSGWYTYHADTGAGKYLELQSTNSAATLSSMWNNTAPTSTVFSVGTAWTSSIDTLAYCFAPVVGYSSVSSYVGNGSSDGPFVYTGFRPRWILFKKSSASQNWHLIDTARDPYNIAGNELYPDLSLQESGGYGNVSRIDVVSNGFKIRTSNDGYNGSAGTYIFAAFAENPFQYARAR